MNFKKNSGLSLIEVIIYVAILGVVAVAVSNFLIQISSTYRKALAEREVISNSRLILERIIGLTTEAKEIYTPTSDFVSDLGQLSLLTKIEPLAGHQNSFVDFWVDNGRLWTRKEGQEPEAISAPSVRVTKFKLERISQGNYEAVKIILKVDYNTSAVGLLTSAELNSTAVLKGNY